MKYETEEEKIIKDQMTVLTIINVIIFSLIAIALLLIWCVDHVYAQPAVRLRAFNLTDNEFISSTNMSDSGNDYMYRALVNMTDNTISSGTNTYFSFKITYGIRTNIQNNNTNVIQNLYSLYWYDTNSNVYNITDQCSLNAIKRETNEDSSILWQWVVTGSCTITPSANLTGFLIDTRYTYQNTNPLYSNRKSAISISNFEISTTPSDGQQIIDNANQNTADIISSASQNTADIIQNQTENSGLIIEALENQNKVCNENIIYRATKENAEVQDKYLQANGNYYNQNNSWISEYYRTDGLVTTIINQTSGNGSRAFCFYDKNKTLISCSSYNTFTNPLEITVTNPTNAYYIRVSAYDTSTVTITTTYCYDYREKETEQMDEFLNYDHNFGSQSDTSYANTTHQNEETMVADLDTNLTGVDIFIDEDANSSIWSIIGVVNRNQVIFTFIISMLSIGIIKLALGR